MGNLNNFQPVRIAILFLGITSFLLPAACLMAQPATSWLDKNDNWPQNKTVLQQYGEQFSSAWDLYQALELAADGGERLEWNDMGNAAYDVRYFYPHRWRTVF